MESLKDLVRPPFANYDVVVYFGGGLFCIPFVNRYLIEPTHLAWPRFGIEVGSPLANEIVSGLSLIFSVYIVGHILAYVSSQAIEKLTDRVLGKISTAIIVSSWSSPRLRNEWIRALIFDRVNKIRRDRSTIATLFRSIFHVPVIPVYIIIYSVGLFSYYDTRIPYSVIQAARLRLPDLGLPNVRMSIRDKWFKPMEYFVINRFPSATSRMYNYLVISGLFRSLCLVFLLSLWAELYYFVHYLDDGDWFLHPFLGAAGRMSAIAEYACLSVIYLFCFCSYLKFQRRYAEEAIFAFVFGNRSSPNSLEDG